MNPNMHTKSRHSFGLFLSSSENPVNHVDTLPQTAKPLSLLQSILECLGDGILIATDQGEVLHANRYAQQLCCRIGSYVGSTLTLHPAIWRICQALIKERNFISDCSEEETASQRTVILDEELHVNESLIRVRVRWLDLQEVTRPCLLITLEDQYESARYRAIAEALKYGLTNRETEVWLLKRIGCTYKQIAAQLHIAEDTVKKHIKNIYARREAIECLSS
ncbi:LuxR C-terminal-related transcriptional regulator [Leptolyngbya sp. FACHB-711]|uniref:helix-turn-helix transcriptional regulator n=2 Tax=unclassified Leptolyngbya TaxID=2650499 RepID=UPI001681E47B|nr:LuxR C-terminal-related transcriptional regulator [Leptolyngbya sp. FACHB-711]